MTRQLLDYRIEINGESIKCFEYGKYIGSISKARLCEAIKHAKKV